MGDTRGRERQPFKYERPWARGPCHLLEADGQIYLAPRTSATGEMQALSCYDPFRSYFDKSTVKQPVHLALATCGHLPPEQQNQILQLGSYTRESKTSFFIKHGCTPEEALLFSEQWGLLEDGHPLLLRSQNVERALPLWAFRSHASLVWGLLQTMRVVCSDHVDTHLCLHWHRLLYWLAGLAGEIVLQGPAVCAGSGIPDWTRMEDAYAGAWRQQPTERQRLAVLLESVLNMLVPDAQPLCRFDLDERGQLRPLAAFPTHTLLGAIQVMLYLDLTGGREARTCCYRRCERLFRINAHQLTAERRGRSVFCEPAHATKEAQLRYREDDRTRVRALERDRQKRSRADRELRHQPGR